MFASFYFSYLFAVLLSTSDMGKVADCISFIFIVKCAFMLLFSSKQEGEIFQHERKFF